MDWTLELVALSEGSLVFLRDSDGSARAVQQLSPRGEEAS